ncbi:MAG TPA: ABC transporter substrate-binding protein [Pseudonocardiaceae bacterium]
MTPPIQSRLLRRVAAAGFAGAVALSLTACAESERDPAPEGGGAKVGGTMTFGAAGAPEMFDPFYATDGETFRVTRQIFDGLVTYKPGTADLAPQLAESWESSEDGLTWTFKLRSGVKFHDGTDFNAEAVCANFTRMFSQTGAGQSESVTTYWIDNMGPGFSDGAKPALYKGCEAPDATTAVLTINRATSKMPNILGLPSFSMQSPKAMEEFKANNVQAAGDSFTYPAYALEHPTGTGPFKFGKYDKANGTIELVRNEEYFDEAGKAKLDKLIFKIIPDETARKQALKAGTIDGYDFPAPADWDGLKSDGFNVQVRPPFNIFYVGITQQNNPALQDLRVRQALAHAINRDQLVKSQLPEGAKVATQFIPDTVDGYNSSLQALPYDVEKAKSLLAEAVPGGLTINFYWPSEVTRPYMPNPRDMFGAISADLEAAGVKINVVTKPWNGGYLDDVDEGRADLFLLGWTGDYNTADNFINTFFGNPNNRFKTQASPWGQELADALKAADTEPDAETRNKMYEQINADIMEKYLPAIPISHSPPALVVTKDIQGLVPSPLTAEDFNTVSKNT